MTIPLGFLMDSMNKFQNSELFSKFEKLSILSLIAKSI